MTSTNKTLLLIDDHELFRAGVVALLSSTERHNILEASNGTEALEIAKTSKLDVIVLDYHLPDTNGLDLLKLLRDSQPHCKIIFLTGSQSGSLAKQALASGADAVLTKRGDGTELLETIATETINPVIGATVQSELEKIAVLDQLTSREHQALSILLSGASTQQLAKGMSVAFKTAESHKTRVMSKMGVHSYGELIAQARKLGILDI
jgi:DNA-binding NarL/FixJ family response regulator